MDKPDPEPIYSVEDVTVSTGKSRPPVLIARARGTVRSGGWHEPALLAEIYIVPPTDGIQGFAFTATPPTGMVTQAMMPIEAEATIPLADWVKGARVKAANNEVLAMLP